MSEEINKLMAQIFNQLPNKGVNKTLLLFRTLHRCTHRPTNRNNSKPWRHFKDIARPILIFAKLTEMTIAPRNITKEVDRKGMKAGQ
jgi:hypothetical protein